MVIMVMMVVKVMVIVVMIKVMVMMMFFKTYRNCPHRELVHSPSTFYIFITFTISIIISILNDENHDLPNCQLCPRREYCKCNLGLLSLWSSPCTR